MTRAGEFGSDDTIVVLLRDTPLPPLADSLQPASISRFPATRYQGSKLKLLDWIAASVQHLSFDSCLDLFSGTASVAYLFKVMGKSVTTNDYLRCNQAVAQALVVNDRERLMPADVVRLLERSPERRYQSFIADTYRDVFFCMKKTSGLTWWRRTSPI